MYPAELVQPMRDELTAVGFKQVNEVETIEAAINAEGTTLVVVNSVCGCAAANARPGVRFSLASADDDARITAREPRRRHLVPTRRDETSGDCREESVGTMARALSDELG